MAGKYEPLAQFLCEAAAREQHTVELGFDHIAELVGGLPASAQVRQWWANNSLVQAVAWRSAGYHVEQVYLDRRRVRFTTGARGGTHRAHADRVSKPERSDYLPPTRTDAGDMVDVRVTMQWYDAGQVTLDGVNKLAFTPLPAIPGLYRLTLVGGTTSARPQVYIGETDNLRRRLGGNYRNPGPTQQTSQRINNLLREHLSAGGVVHLARATAASVWLPDGERALDLTRKAGRLLAENAALVRAHVDAKVDIVNLG